MFRKKKNLQKWSFSYPTTHKPITTRMFSQLLWAPTSPSMQQAAIPAAQCHSHGNSSYGVAKETGNGGHSLWLGTSTPVCRTDKVLIFLFFANLFIDNWWKYKCWSSCCTTTIRHPPLLRWMKRRKKLANTYCIDLPAILTHVLSALPWLWEPQCFVAYLNAFMLMRALSPCRVPQQGTAHYLPAHLATPHPAPFICTGQLRSPCLKRNVSPQCTKASAAQLTPLTMPQRFEGAAQSRIKHSNCISRVRLLSCPSTSTSPCLSETFHAGKKESEWNRMKNCCSVGLSQCLSELDLDQDIITSNRWDFAPLLPAL